MDAKVNKTVEIDQKSLEDLADYVADDLKEHGGPEMEYLEDAVRNAYDAIEE